MNDTAIQAEGLGKRYVLGHSSGRHDTVRDVLAEGARSLFTRSSKRAPDVAPFWALRDASFVIAQGENVGVIGLNGAGKSTLLKVLSRIAEPTAGSVRITGRVGALLEVGTGFHGELTGRENVFLYGSILGMRSSEISNKLDEIVAFAEIEKFIDTPVKRYSSGMYVRLAFSVAAQLRPEILLLDEVLSVGDLSFQRKCIEYSKSLQRSNSTILFVSHNMFSIKAMCERVIYLKQGRVLFDGATDRGIEIYEQDCRLGKLPWLSDKEEELPVQITDFALFGEDGRQKTIFNRNERMIVRLSYDVRQPIDRPNFIVAFIRSDGVACCCYSSTLDDLEQDPACEVGAIELVIPPLKLVAEMYTVHVVVRKGGFDQVIGGQIGSTFHIRDQLLDTNFGVFHEPAIWRSMSRQKFTPLEDNLVVRGRGD